MFSVYSTREGRPYKHAVKPLKVIWTHFPQFNAKNTVHIDDLVGMQTCTISNTYQYL